QCTTGTMKKCAPARARMRRKMVLGNAQTQDDEDRGDAYEPPEDRLNGQHVHSMREEEFNQQSKADEEELQRSRSNHEQSSFESASGPDQGTSSSPRPSNSWLDPIDAATFATADYKPDWLVKKLLVANQPVLAGGPQKGMKTSLMADLAISLATG